MRAFNAFQIVCAFVGWPFLIQFLSKCADDAAFRGAGAAFWAACACYIVAFFLMIVAVYESIGKWDK